MRLFGFLILFVLVGGLFLSVFLHPTSQQSGQRPELYFRMNLGSDPPTLDPAEVNDLVSMAVLTNIMRGLTQYGSKGQVAPDYAERWEQSADGKRYVFHLRRNGFWRDGKHVTAHDFVYAWRRVLDPKVASPYAFLLFDIRGARDFYNGKLMDVRQLGIQAVDDYTLAVTLDRPVAFFLQLTSFSITLPQRRDIIERYGQSFTEAGHNVTNGPYQLAEWSHENRILLTPDPHYWAGRPQNKGIEMLMIPEPNTSLIMYENNELDFVETTSSLPSKEVRRLKGRPDFYARTLHGITYIGFNTQKPPLNDVRVRKALIQAFDRTFIPKLFQSGERPIASWITPGLFGYNPQIGLPFDVPKARQWLAEAGYPGGKGFPKVSFMYASTSPENRQMAEIAQFQWHQNLGIDVEITNLEWKMFLKQLAEDPPPIYRLQWYVDYPDPDSFMNVFISDSGNGHIGWKNKSYDALVSRAAVTLDPDRRLALYNQAQRLLLAQDACILPLYVIPKSYLLKPRVQGFMLNELNLPILDRVQVLPVTGARCPVHSARCPVSGG